MDIVAYLDQLGYEGQVGGTVELVRYSPQDDNRFAWGLFALGDILLGEDGATFPMKDADFYIGTYFSGQSGDFSFRIEGLHESTHLGDSFQTIVQTPEGGSLGSSQLPLYYNQEVTYTRENVNGTISLQPSEFFRLYAGAGVWDISLIEGVSDPFFASFGTEIYSAYWQVDNSAMRAYLTGSLDWKGDQEIWDLEVQLGLQWKAFKDSDRALRVAVLYYTGDSQFGQFYNVPDSHLALATFFDF